MDPVMRHVDVDGGSLAVTVRGSGSPVVMIPSLGRGAGDFDHLATRVAAAGFTAICPEPRGIGATTAPVDSISMATLASDVAAVVAAFGADPACLVGHAFGNRVARMTATDHPDAVAGVALLACGGVVPASGEADRSLRAVFDESLPADEHLRHVRTAFFASGNDPAVWAGGWHPVVAFFQGEATRATPVERWFAAGRAPVLVVQPADDVIAVPANAADIVDRLGGRAELVTIDNAGHALLPEQPDEVAAVVIGWFANRFA